MGGTSKSVSSNISSFFLPASAIFKAGSSTSCTGNKVILPTSCSSKPNNNATLVPKPILISKNEYDVANFRVKAKHMDNLQIADLIKNVFKPDKSYSFPISKTNGRSFLYKWFDNYSWLCYSPSLDGAFCLPCVLFGDRFPTKTSTIKKLFSEPITHWNDTSAAFKRHVGLGTKAGSKSGLHKSTSALFTSFISQMYYIIYIYKNKR